MLLAGQMLVVGKNYIRSNIVCFSFHKFNKLLIFTNILVSNIYPPQQLVSRVTKCKPVHSSILALNRSKFNYDKLQNILINQWCVISFGVRWNRIFKMVTMTTIVVSLVLVQIIFIFWYCTVIIYRICLLSKCQIYSG